MADQTDDIHPVSELDILRGVLEDIFGPDDEDNDEFWWDPLELEMTRHERLTRLLAVRSVGDDADEVEDADEEGIEDEDEEEEGEEEEGHNHHHHHHHHHFHHHIEIDEDEGEHANNREQGEVNNNNDNNPNGPNENHVHFLVQLARNFEQHKKIAEKRKQQQQNNSNNNNSAHITTTSSSTLSTTQDGTDTTTVPMDNSSSSTSNVVADFTLVLPPELAFKIFSFLTEATDLQSASQVSTTWRDFVNRESFWKEACLQFWVGKYKFGLVSSLADIPLTLSEQDKQFIETHKMPLWKAYYYLAIQDSKRTQITFEELVSAQWMIRFRHRFSMGMPLSFSRFQRDMTYLSEFHQAPLPWRFIEASFGLENTILRKERLIQVAAYPPLSVTRFSDWSFRLRNKWVMFRAVSNTGEA